MNFLIITVQMTVTKLSINPLFFLSPKTIMSDRQSIQLRCSNLYDRAQNCLSLAWSLDFLSLLHHHSVPAFCLNLSMKSLNQFPSLLPLLKDAVFNRVTQESVRCSDLKELKAASICKELMSPAHHGSILSLCLFAVCFRKT